MIVSAEEWAEKVGSISYEVFCQLSKRVPRIYKGTDKGTETWISGA